MPVPASKPRRIVPVPDYPGLFVRSWRLRERVTHAKTADDDQLAYVVWSSLCDEAGELVLTSIDDAYEMDGKESLAIIRTAMKVNGLDTAVEQEKKD